MDLNKIDINELTEEEKQKLTRLLTPKTTKYIIHEPHEKQTAFLLLDVLEAMYGGAAGGGKSDALLMAALQYVDEPDYAAILFRKSFADLALPGALIDRSKEWLTGFDDVRWHDREKTWYFPSGATLTFGYLENENDKYRYASSEFQFIGFDELTQLTEDNYRFLFSRLRRLKKSKIPLRVRAASNPGNLGHEWVKQRFLIEGPEKGRVFIPADIDDNPYLNADEYDVSLQQLDHITREQLRWGNWDITREGNMFKKSWFPIVDTLPKTFKKIRYWDLAATEITNANKRKKRRADTTVGLKMIESGGVFIIEDVIKVKQTPKDVEDLIRKTAERDGKAVQIGIEQEPGASGIYTLDHYKRNVLKGFIVKEGEARVNKVVRAQPASAAAERGLIQLYKGDWNESFLNEAEAFPSFGVEDNQIDTLSGAYANLASSMSHNMAIPIEIMSEYGSYWKM